MSWVTGPLGTGLLPLLWWQARQGKGPFATGGAWERNYAERDVAAGERPSRPDPERDSLRKTLEETQVDRERLRGLLGGAEQALATCKRAFALARIAWFGERFRMNIEHQRALVPLQPLPDVRVTVRFAVYDDFALAQQIKAILEEHARWEVTLDNRNAPVIKPEDRFKVIFESSESGTFNDVACAFEDGSLIPCSIGVRRADRPDQGHLIVEVLPTVAKP